MDPVAGALVKMGITANGLTAVGLLGTIAAAVLIAQGRFGIGAAVFVPSAFLDLFDGMIARRMGTASRWGALVDAVSDRAGESALLIALAWRFRVVNPRIAAVALSAMAFSFLVSYVKARAESLGFTCEGGFAERAERAILYGTALLIVGAAEAAMWALAVLAAITAIQRLVIVRRQAIASASVPPG